MATLATPNDSKFLDQAKRRRGLLFGGGLALLLLLILGSIYIALYSQLHEKREQEQYRELTEMHQKVIEEVNSVGADLAYFAQSDLAQATLSQKDAIAQSFLTSLMLNIGALQQRYDQLRLFDPMGNELIRLNQQPDQTMALVPESELQNKAGRYYFQESKELPTSQLYISRFDLNVEQGQVERPLKPMIRFGTAIRNEEGQLIGVGMLNYNGLRIHSILDTLNRHKDDQVFLINQQGYLLKSPYPDSEWGFMLPERAEQQFQAFHPKIWQQIQRIKSGDTISSKGEFYFKTFKLAPTAPFQNVQGEELTLIMHVPYSVIHQGTVVLLQGLVIAFLILAPVLGLLGWKLGHYQVGQAWLFQQLEFEARHDSLTGLFNRKAIMEFLQQNLLLTRRREAPLSVGFIDVNDLKLMNDQHGHEMGDELIRGVAQAINEVIRGSDAAARIGGDEFLIVFIDCDSQGAQSIMARIERMFTSMGLLHTGLPWSMSYGCATLEGELDTLEKLIERADNQMYQHKQQLKQARKVS